MSFLLSVEHIGAEKAEARMVLVQAELKAREPCALREPGALNPASIHASQCGAHVSHNT